MWIEFRSPFKKNSQFCGRHVPSFYVILSHENWHLLFLCSLSNRVCLKVDAVESIEGLRWRASDPLLSSFESRLLVFVPWHLLRDEMEGICSFTEGVLIESRLLVGVCLRAVQVFGPAAANPWASAAAKKHTCMRWVVISVGPQQVMQWAIARTKKHIYTWQVKISERPLSQQLLQLLHRWVE